MCHEPMPYTKEVDLDGAHRDRPFSMRNAQVCEGYQPISLSSPLFQHPKASFIQSPCNQYHTRPLY